jgi:hypothetical protein
VRHPQQQQQQRLQGRPHQQACLARLLFTAWTAAAHPALLSLLPLTAQLQGSSCLPALCAAHQACSCSSSRRRARRSSTLQPLPRL